jgi:aldehyde dehydrogenase (NAD+)
MAHIAAEVRQFIDGEYVRGAGQAFTVQNPGTEEIIAEVPGASLDQVEAAIKSARAAFDSGVWSGLPTKARVEILTKFMGHLASRREQLIELSVKEAGCPINSPVMFAQVAAPLQHGLDTLDLFQQLPEFEENPLPLRERVNFRGGAIQSIRRYLPVGVVSAISAYNFPFYTNLWKVIPALITGNTVILRPNPLTPLAALIFGEAAQASGLPKGVLNIVADQALESGVLM